MQDPACVLLLDTVLLKLINGIIKGHTYKQNMLWVSVLMKEDLVAIPLPVRKKEIVYFQLSLNCSSLVLAHFRIWASSEFGHLCFLPSISTRSVSLCLCVSISSCMSLHCQRFLCVFSSLILCLCVFVCVCSGVWWQFQGWVYRAYPLSWVSLPLWQQPEVHLDNWGQLRQHCQVA